MYNKKGQLERVSMLKSFAQFASQMNSIKKERLSTSVIDITQNEVLLKSIDKKSENDSLN